MYICTICTVKYKKKVVDVWPCVFWKVIIIHLFTPCSESHLGSGVDRGGGLGVYTGVGGCKAEVGEATGAGGRHCRRSRLASEPGWTWWTGWAGGGCGGDAGSGGVWASGWGRPPRARGRCCPAWWPWRSADTGWVSRAADQPCWRRAGAAAGGGGGGRGCSLLIAAAGAEEEA